MGNSFGKKKKDGQAVSKEEMGVPVPPVGITISGEIQSKASDDKILSQTDSSEYDDDASDSDEADSPPPSPPAVKKQAWSGAQINQKIKDESAMKATRNTSSMNLTALPPYHNVVTGKIDGGCSTTMLSQRTYDQLCSAGAVEQLAPASSVTSIYKFANGETKRANCHIAIAAEINGHQAEVHANVFNDPNTHFLLGLNFLRGHKVSIQYHPDGDRINCPALGLYNRILPRDTAGLDFLPFFAPFPGELNAGMSAHEMMKSNRALPPDNAQMLANLNRRRW